MEEPKPTNRALERAAWVVLAIALAFSLFVRSRLAEFPLERDEGEYAYAGQLILQGVPPYSLAYNMKLPGTYLAYAGLMAVFGQTTPGVHLGLLVVNLASIILLFLLTRDLFDSITAAVAAIAFSIMSVDWHVLGMAAHATHFVALFGIAGTWVLWRAIRSERIALFPVAGVLLGLAFLMKQQGVFFLCFGGAATLFYCAQRRPLFSGRRVAACLLYGIGAVLPFAATCLWLWQAGTFPSFWFWTVEYAQTYVNQVPLGLAASVFWASLHVVAANSWPIWMMALLGAVSLACSKGVPRRRTFVFLFLVFSFLCVCPGFWFRNHYFIVFLPSVAMLAGVGSVAMVRIASQFINLTDGVSPGEQARPSPRRQSVRDVQQAGNPDLVARRVLMVLAALISTAVIAFPVLLERRFFFSWSPEKACRSVYGLNPFVECPVIADYLEKHSKPDDRVAVLGSEPEIFFDARRRSATGYIYTYAMMEPQPFARKMQDEMIGEIESAKPEFLVIVNVTTSWLMVSKSDLHILDWLGGYAAANYRPVGLVDIISENETDYKWDDEAVGAQPRSQCYLWILRRKS